MEKQSEEEQRYTIASRFGQLFFMRAIGEEFTTPHHYSQLSHINFKPLADVEKSEEAVLQMCCLAYDNPTNLRQEMIDAMHDSSIYKNDRHEVALGSTGLISYRGKRYTFADGVQVGLDMLEQYHETGKFQTDENLARAAFQAISMTPFFLGKYQQNFTAPHLLTEIVRNTGHDYDLYIGLYEKEDERDQLEHRLAS